MLIRDRHDAGQLLANKLLRYKNSSNSMVLALPRGGVPVAYEIATNLSLPLDILIVRKIGLPGHEEYAIGAITTNNIMVVNPEIEHLIDFDSKEIQQIIKKEKEELKRRNKVYRQDKPFPDLTNKKVILVDDGIATGASIKAAIFALKKFNLSELIIATPILPPSALEELTLLVNKIVYLSAPEPFFGVGKWYMDFPQTTDKEVISLLQRANASYLESKSLLSN